MVTAEKQPRNPPLPVEDDEDEDEDSPYIAFMQAVRKYGISRQALHNLCVKRQVPYFTRYNGRRLFWKEEADQYLGLTRVEAITPLPRVRGLGMPKSGAKE